jgi:cell division protein FtsL
MTPPAAASAAPRGRVAAPLRPRVAPPRPRRVSGPVRPPVRRPAGGSAPAVATPSERGLVLGLLGAVGSLTSHGAIDRLIRGRVWIAVIAFALIGIVTLQLLVLQLNADVGRSLVREAQLQSANAALSVEDSELAGGERVESRAAYLGMQLVPAGALRFLTSYPPADIAHAAAALNTPVQGTGSSSSAAAGSSTGSTGEAEASAESSTTAAAGSSSATAAGSGEQAPSTEQSAGTEQAPAGETTAPESTHAAVGTSGEGASTGEASASTSAPTTAAGGTEPTGAG